MAQGLELSSSNDCVTSEELVLAGAREAERGCLETTTGSRSRRPRVNWADFQWFFQFCRPTVAGLLVSISDIIQKVRWMNECSIEWMKCFRKQPKPDRSLAEAAEESIKEKVGSGK